MKINWITLFVNNFEESKRFYGEYLGFKPEREFSPNEHMDIAFFAAENGVQIELIHQKNKKAAPLSNNGVSIGVSSKDYDRLLRIAREKNILTAEPAVLGGYLECFYVADPDGLSIQIAKQVQ